LYAVRRSIFETSFINAYFLQDALIEKLLQLFIAIVDAELFKTIGLEVL
jgi:hypothetical protein